MKCEEIKRFASLYIDGEFDESERALFEQHLADCPSCREDVAGLAAFQQALKKRLGRPHLATETRARYVGVIQQEVNRSIRFAHVTVPAAIAASLLIVVGAFFAYQSYTAPDELSRMVDESIAAHEASLPPEVEGDGEAIKGYLAEHDELQSEPPLQEDDNTRLVGVRLTRVGKTRALLYRYLHQGRNISVVQLPRRLPGPEDIPRPSQREVTRVLYRGARNGHAVTTFESPRYTNTVVGDIPEPDLLKLVPTSL